MLKQPVADLARNAPKNSLFIRIFNPKHLAFPLTIGLCMLLLLYESDAVISYMNQGLLLCAKTVIPSLFPFMVLAEFMVCSGCGELLGKLCERPMRRIFGISGAGACAFIMGALCGFPIGTKTAVSLHQRGEISTEELSRLICFCNIPSSAFLINAVGISLFENRRFGIFLYLICLFSAFITAYVLRRSPSFAPMEPHQNIVTPPSGISVFTHAVTSAATAILYVCAYVIFFSALVGTLGEFLFSLGAGPTAIAALFGLFELSGGVAHISSLPDPILSHWLTALFCGWSGLSVHLQILSLCGDIPIRAHRYFLCKLLQGVLCAFLCGVFLYFAPNSWFIPETNVSQTAIQTIIHPHLLTTINLSLLFAWLIALIYQGMKMIKSCRKQ